MEKKLSLDKVMRKIQKLKALYEGAKKINSEGEAANAAALMQKLLAEYNLSIEEVSEFNDKPEDKIIHENLSGYTYKSIGGYWEQRLTYVLCKWNFCRCYMIGNTYRKLIIVGERHNLENVKWMLDVLKERYVSFSKTRYKEYKSRLMIGDKPMSLDKFQRSYLMGCAAGLDDKLKAEHEREKKEEVELSKKITALAVRKGAALQAYVDKTWGKARTRHYKENYDCARYTGVKDGRNTEINKPISAGKAAVTPKMLGY